MHLVKKIFSGFVILVCIGISVNLNSQTVWENENSGVYQYLYRLAQKGILRFDDNIRPLSRMYLSNCLDSVNMKSAMLSPVEKKELAFYKQEYSDEKILSLMNTTSTKFLQKDSVGRWRAFSASGKDFLMRIDPVITYNTLQGSGKNVTAFGNGFKLYGYAGKHWSYYFSYNDVTEKGNGIDTLRQNTPTQGIVTRIANSHQSHNYSELKGGISYTWKNGLVSIGQDNFIWGYGENGRIVSSSKPPAFPYFRFDYKPLPWLGFNYTHAWLNSNIIDSAKTYGTGGSIYGGQRIIYRSKYFASHTIQIKPAKGWDINIGESIVYSDRLNIGYLIPILYFKAFDNLNNNQNINAGSNGQLFVQVSSRNNIPKTHAFASIFVDEIKFGSLFSKKDSRNQFGYTLGLSKTDILLPYLTFGIEYTRINPFVYRNLLPTQNYTSYDYSLGDWMGNNADRLILFAKYTPLPRLKCQIRYQSIRKGGPGTLNQQYFQQPQPAFLFDLQNKQKEWFAQVSYEWINNLYVSGYLSTVSIDDNLTGKKTKNTLISLGINYGL